MLTRLQRNRITQMYDTENAPISIYSRERKTYIHVQTYTQMFIATSFIITRNWEQPRHPSTGKWLNKLKFRCNHTMKFYSIFSKKKE